MTNERKPTRGSIQKALAIVASIAAEKKLEPPRETVCKEIAALLVAAQVHAQVGTPIGDESALAIGFAVFSVLLLAERLDDEAASGVKAAQEGEAAS